MSLKNVFRQIYKECGRNVLVASFFNGQDKEWNR